MKKTLMTCFLMAGVFTSSAVLADKDGDAVIEYRQAHMSLVGANFKPMVGMLKGKVEFDAATVQGMAADLVALSGLNWQRGFAEGSADGKTKAKKGIWKNMEDFESKYEDFKTAAASLNEVAQGGSKDAILAQIKELGGSCKACHKEYKSK